MSDTPGPAGVGPLSHAIFRVARLHRSIAGRLLRETGLHPGQELVLMTLWGDGAQRQVDLAAAIDSDAPTMARSLARLERAGLVRRTRSDRDRRVVLVEATEESLALRPKVEAAWRELERLPGGPLSPGQQRDVVAGLGLLEQNLEPHER